MYELTFNFGSTNNLIDTPFVYTVLGPNGENETTLTSAGWSFTRVDGNTISIGRPSSKQIQPLVNIMSHGKDGGGDWWSKAPTAVNTSGLAAKQTYSAGKFTTLTVYGLNASNTGLYGTGITQGKITFGLVS